MAAPGRPPRAGPIGAVLWGPPRPRSAPLPPPPWPGSVYASAATAPWPLAAPSLSRVVAVCDRPAPRDARLFSAPIGPTGPGGGPSAGGEGVQRGCTAGLLWTCWAWGPVDHRDRLAGARGPPQTRPHPPTLGMPGFSRWPDFQTGILKILTPARPHFNALRHVGH